MTSESGKAICVILAYNCAPMLENTYRRIPKGSVDRVILVDDGSTDSTLTVAKHLGIECYTHPNLGYGGNIKYSIRKALELGAEYIVDLHGDGQYDPAAIPAALERAREGNDLVLGTRFKPDIKQPLRDGMSYARYFANIGLSTIERLVTFSNISEFHTGFRVYTKRLAETVALQNTSDNFLFGFEIIVQAIYAGLRVGEVPIRCDYNKEHTSISIPKSIAYAFQTFKVLALYIFAKLGIKTKLFKNIRAHPKVGQIIRFTLAGSSALVVNLVMLYFFTEVLGIYYIISTVLAFFVALVVSFTLQKFWTFRDDSRDHLHFQIPVYLGMQLANVTLNAFLMYAFVEYLHIGYLFSQVFISLLLAAIVFLINRKYIFRPRRQ